MTINYVAIRKDGRTITGQKETFYSAAAELRRMLADGFYNDSVNPIKKLFMSDGNYLTEYLPSEIANEDDWTAGR